MNGPEESHSDRHLVTRTLRKDPSTDNRSTEKPHPFDTNTNTSSYHQSHDANHQSHDANHSSSNDRLLIQQNPITLPCPFPNLPIPSHLTKPIHPNAHSQKPTSDSSSTSHSTSSPTPPSPSSRPASPAPPPPYSSAATYPPPPRHSTNTTSPPPPARR